MRLLINPEQSLVNAKNPMLKKLEDGCPNSQYPSGPPPSFLLLEWTANYALRQFLEAQQNDDEEYLLHLAWVGDSFLPKQKSVERCVSA